MDEKFRLGNEYRQSIYSAGNNNVYSMGPILWVIQEGKKWAIVGQKDRDWGSSGDCFAVTENQNRDLGAVDVFPSGRNWSSVCSVDTRARLPISPIYPLFSFHPPPTTTVGWSMTIAGFIRISRAGWSPGKKFSGAHAVGGASKVQSSSWEKKQILSMT